MKPDKKEYLLKKNFFLQSSNSDKLIFGVTSKNSGYTRKGDYD